MSLMIEVALTPQAQGSIKSFAHPSTGKIVSMSTNKRLKPYREAIARAAAIEVAKQGWRTDTSYELSLSFAFKRPKSVKRAVHIVRPDVDKLVRAIFDSLTGIVYKDDSQVWKVSAEKHYASSDAVSIMVWEERGA